MRCNTFFRSSILVIAIIIATLDANCQIQGLLGQDGSKDETPREAYNLLLNTSLEMGYLDMMISLSDWDQGILMPPNAIDYRAKAQSYLTDLENKKHP